jgi:phospholipid-translocating ATPase
MHNKTLVPLAGFLITVGGWWIWTLTLAGLMKPSKSYPLYPVYQDFIDGFGRSLLWWLVLFLALASATLLEIGVSSIRKTFWPTDTEVFQVLQKDKACRERFEEAVRADEEGREVVMGVKAEVKTSAEEKRREGEIQKLLDKPRVMTATATDVDSEVVRSPVEVVEGPGRSRRASGQQLTRRQVSIDISRNNIGIVHRTSAPLPKTRRSIDIAEVLE